MAMNEQPPPSPPPPSASPAASGPPRADSAQPPHPAARHAAPAPLATTLSLLLPLAVVMAFLLLVAGTVTAVARWWLFEEAGSQWLVQRLPLVQVQGFKGALLGDRWQFDRLHVTWARGQQSLTLEDLSATGLRWAWRPDEHALVGLQIDQLQVRRMELHTGQPGGRPVAVPADIALPLALTMRRGQVAELQVDGHEPVRALAVGGLALDARPGGQHAVERVLAEWQGVSVEAGGHIATRAPLALQLQGTLRPARAEDAPRWAAVLQAQGPLAELQVTATLRGVPLAGREPPAVDLKAQLRPLQGWPLDTLDLQTRELDLSALSIRTPQTRLSGSAVLRARAKDAPMSAEVQLENTLPGRWNEQRLPVRRLKAELRGDLQQPDRLQLQALEATLSDATRTAGSISGSAVWQGHELSLDVRLGEVTPQRLDGRAAAMTLSGPVTATLRGLRSPSGSAPPPDSPSLRWKLALEGQLDAAPRPVRLTMEGQAGDQQLEISQLQASSGGASAELTARLQKAGPGDWQLQSAGSLIDFDPLPWWPGESGSTWRKGPHRLSAGWQFDLRLPGNAAGLATIELAQRLAGSGVLRVHDSVVAGVPVSADIKLGYTHAALPTPALLRAELLLGGNQITLEGRGDPTGPGPGDRWRVEVNAESMSTLAPLSRLHPALAEWVPRQGSGQLTLAADGRWPNLRTEGSAHVAQLLVGPVGLAEGQLNWSMDAGGDRALMLRLDLAGLQWGRQKADHLRGTIQGTVAEHQIDLAGAMPLLPPELAVKLLGVQAQSGTSGQLQALGRWLPAAEGGGRWRAKVDRLTVGSWDGSAADAAPASLWAQARDLRTEVDFDASGALVSLRADAGRMQFADDVALRWDEVKVDLRGARPQIQLRADIEPFLVAPLMARLQPSMGWAGDIRLGARVDIRAAERFDADLVFERKDGDLHVAGNEGMQLLGLTDMRLALTAHDGLWTFTPVFKGRSLGEITGSARVQTTPERRWPHAEAPLQGEVRARVADLGIWGAWVPPGWRLAGELSTVAALGGRFGDPRYTGDIIGRGLSVRNLLQGVNVSDGQVGIKLEGDKATIERFVLKGGDGTLAVSGNALLGATPQARLLFKAERFRAIGRVDRMAIASGQAELNLSGDQARLEGRLVLDEALYDASRGDAPSLDEDVTVQRPGDVEAVGEDKRAAGPRRNLALALEIDLGKNTRVRGRGLDTELTGSLRLANPGGRFEVRGTINTADGTYAAYGQKLALERGIVAFAGPPDNPRLDILALRSNTDQRVGVVISGTLLTPRVRLYSEPDMSDTEKLSWLLLGRAPDGLGRSDTALLQRAAVALISGEGEAPTDALMKSLGIDELSLKQSEGDVRDTVITLGKQLSRRWYLGYERGVNATTGTWQLIYRIAQRFTLRAQSGLENSLDVIWTWRFQETPPDAAMRKSSVTPP